LSSHSSGCGIRGLGSQTILQEVGYGSMSRSQLVHLELWGSARGMRDGGVGSILELAGIGVIIGGRVESLFRWL